MHNDCFTRYPSIPISRRPHRIGALSLVALGAYFLVPLIQVQPTDSEIVTSVVIEIEEVPIEQGFTEELLSADKLPGINHGFVIEFDDSIEVLKDTDLIKVLKDTDLIKVTIDGSEHLLSMFTSPMGYGCDVSFRIEPNNREADVNMGHVRIGEQDDTSKTICAVYLAEPASPMPN